MPDNTQESVRINIRDINPLEHITSDITKSRSNYEAILNGLVTWNTTDSENVTVRLATDDYPYFVDYTFPSRAARMAGGNTFAGDGLQKGLFDYVNMIDMTATTTDETTLRLTVAEGNYGSWTVFEEAIVYDENSAAASRAYKPGQYLRYPKGGVGAKTVCVATDEIAVGEPFSTANTQPAVTKWKTSEYEDYNAYPGIVTFSTKSTSDAHTIIDKAYIRRAPGTNKAPWESEKWETLAESIDTKAVGTYYERGMLYVYAAKQDFSDAAIYMYIGKDPIVKTADNPPLPVDAQGELAENWYGPLILVPIYDVSSSAVLHHRPTTDISGFIMRSNSYDVSSVSAIANIAAHEGSSEPHKGLKIFSTSNYVLWPENDTSIWVDGTDYSGSSSYTAKMVFHHASDDVKMCNIINYDGPDLDNGLSIYLPANDYIEGDNGETAYVEAQDGATFEFMFRIWPNAAYNGASSPDLIINKAQIYVYTVRRSDELEAAKVLAKFSMARLTNFYLWAENVAVPNRPVFYKAKFIYSKEAGEWRTYDYYQIPDHVFLSPKGFVDPSIRNSTDGDSYGDDGPFSGVQTAGFPLMQDPFGGLNMNAVLLNRIEPDE